MNTQLISGTKSRPGGPSLTSKFFDLFGMKSTPTSSAPTSSAPTSVNSTKNSNTVNNTNFETKLNKLHDAMNKTKIYHDQIINNIYNLKNKMYTKSEIEENIKILESFKPYILSINEDSDYINDIDTSIAMSKDCLNKLKEKNNLNKSNTYKGGSKNRKTRKQRISKKKSRKNRK